MITSGEIVAVRQKLQLSQEIFAKSLHIELKTLRNWEQGRAKPNAQGAVLIRLVDRHPELIGELAPGHRDTERQVDAGRRGAEKYFDALAELAK